MNPIPVFLIVATFAFAGCTTPATSEVPYSMVANQAAPAMSEPASSADQGDPPAPPSAANGSQAKPTLEIQTLYRLNGTFQGALHIVAPFDAPAGTHALGIDAPFGRNCVGGGRTTLTWPDGRVTGKGAWECNVGGSCVMCGLGGGKAGPGRYTLEIAFVGTTEMDLRVYARVVS